MADSKYGWGFPSHQLSTTLLRLSGAALILFLLLQSASLAAQGSRSYRTSLLLVRVGEESQLQMSGSTVILKIRLAPGVVSRLWSDKACGDPTDEAIVIPRSDTYAIALQDIPHGNLTYLCLLLSDGKLHNSLAMPPRDIESVETGGAGQTRVVGTVKTIAAP